MPEDKDKDDYIRGVCSILKRALYYILLDAWDDREIIVYAAYVLLKSFIPSHISSMRIIRSFSLKIINKKIISSSFLLNYVNCIIHIV
jgi:hypothetical protein